MESDCCGAYSDCSEDIDICPACGEHADWNDEEEIENTDKWVVLEEDYPIATKLSYEDAVALKERLDYVDLGFKNRMLFYDEYYEFTEIEIEN
jgi:hypothetical protein